MPEPSDPLGTPADPEHRTPGGSDTPQPGKCGAKLRRSDPPRYCKRIPTTGRTRCKFHGGTTPRGIAAGSFRNGATSIAMPTRMQAAYDEAVADPEMLSLRREIGTHRAMSSDILRMLRDADHVDVGAATTAYRDAHRAQRVGDIPRFADAMTRLGAALEGLKSWDALRRELRKEDELVQKFTRAENDRMEQLHQMVSREQALAFMRALAIVVKEAVENNVIDSGIRASVLRVVSTGFEQLARGRGPTGVSPVGLAARGDVVDPASDDG